MWTIAVILLGLTIAVGILSTIPRLARPLRPVAGGAALLVVALAIFGASFRYVGENQVGIIVKNVGASLPSGQIIATAGEKGPQARVLPPGWHPWLWPVIYDVQVESIIEIDQDEVGIITTTDGQPLPDGQVYAPEWSDDQMKRMADAEYFLTEGGGFKGPQTTVLTPGKHRLNTRLFRVEKHPVTNIAKAEVGVVKSNVGRAPVVMSALLKAWSPAARAAFGPSRTARASTTSTQKRTKSPLCQRVSARFSTPREALRAKSVRSTFDLRTGLHSRLMCALNTRFDRKMRRSSLPTFRMPRAIRSRIDFTQACEASFATTLRA